VPGYELIGNILKGFATQRDAYPAVLVNLHGPGTALFGLVMEEHRNGILTVFVPSAPALTIGNLHIVEREHIVSILEDAEWKISGESGAAARLGIPPSTLRSKMKKLGIVRPH